jgi:hypothetical protein
MALSIIQQIALTPARTYHELILWTRNERLKFPRILDNVGLIAFLAA